VSGVLYLVPTPLGDAGALEQFSTLLRSQVQGLDYFVAENAKTARAFLKLIEMPRAIVDLRIETIAQDTDEEALTRLLQPIEAGQDAGLLSEAGAPAVADPGARLVALAHAKGVRVVPLVGPCAILLALMGSGLNGQQFAFHGYLPVEEVSLRKKVQELEGHSRQKKQTQLFIETPYRNDRLLRVLIECCAPDTRLCVATQLTQPDESIATRRIADWKSAMPAIGKRPTVFLLLA
jgi:16S rRNA (cytidine1402-2'-O)-methyltransferase